jgi:phosphate transport system protein
MSASSSGSRPQLDSELATLRRHLVDMATLVDEQLANAMNALIQGDVERGEAVAARDSKVDALELTIDQHCERILALHTPVAADLRMIIMAVKINTDFERIGDHCRNLARYTAPLAGAPDMLAATTVPRMADIARNMLRGAEEAFLERDRVKARTVIARDQQVNRLHAENLSTLIAKMQQHPEATEALSYLITASKAVERISDHAKNVAQGIVFLVEGNDIRHQRLTDIDRPSDQ